MAAAASRGHLVHSRQRTGAYLGNRRLGRAGLFGDLRVRDLKRRIQVFMDLGARHGGNSPACTRASASAFK